MASSSELDLQYALDGRIPYTLLNAPLRQRLTIHDYHKRTVEYSIMRSYAYHRLPEYIRDVMTEGAYYEQMIEVGIAMLQIYPYAHQQRIVFYTRTTALSYYQRILADILKMEQSYDRLPNFTAVDVLRVLGIGRNQYLEITKEVRSKLRWHINRNYVTEFLPTSMEVSNASALHPFWVVSPVESLPPEQVRRICQPNPEDLILYNLLLRKGLSATNDNTLQSLCVSEEAVAKDFFFACELPLDSINRLHRQGLVYATFAVDPEDCMLVPPLSQFVMNRTSGDPQELLMYRILSTLDDRTPLHLLTQLLMLDEEDVLSAVSTLMRLGLVKEKHPKVPASLNASLTSVHATWRHAIEGLSIRSTRAPPAQAECTPGTTVPGQSDTTTLTHSTPLPFKRIALLYDATLTGFLMMTNLSKDPLFKQYAVTLFEVGKMPDEMIGGFLELLDQVRAEDVAAFGGAAQKYVNSVMCLRELLKALKSFTGTEESPSRGVDLLKIESLNELAATTRYSVLGRNYWAYIVTTPLACSPLIDVELSCVYGNTASLSKSPWLVLYLYEKLHRGPQTIFIPFGSLMHSWPPEMVDSEEGYNDEAAEPDAGRVAKLRVQSPALDAEVSYHDMDSSLLLINEMTSTSPVFVQCTSHVPLTRRRDGSVYEKTTYKYLEVAVPFTATRDDALHLARQRIISNDEQLSARNTAVILSDEKNLLQTAVDDAVNALALHHSLGYVTCCCSYYEDSFLALPSQECDKPIGTQSTCVVMDSAYVVSLNFGMPLTHVGCFDYMLASLPQLLSEENSERHNAAMRVCVTDFSRFMEQYSTLTCHAYEKLALQSTDVTGPMTQLHLRTFGAHKGLPFPSATLFFDGSALRTMDDFDELSEQW